MASNKTLVAVTVDVIRVLVVDDHPIIRRGLAQLFKQVPGLELAGEVETPEEAIPIVQAGLADIVLLDLSLKDCSGIEVIPRLLRERPDQRILVLSMHDEIIYAERALRAGARGYIMKEESTDHVVEAIRRICEGGIYLSERVSHRLLDKAVGGRARGPHFPVESLTNRELQVFEMFGQGMGTRQLADQLKLSVKTVEVHRENIKRKLKVSGSNDMLRHAIEWVQSGKAY